jgi:hypothetical protein
LGLGETAREVDMSLWRHSTIGIALGGPPSPA